MKTKFSMFWFFWWTCYCSLMALMLSLIVAVVNMNLGMTLMVICLGLIAASIVGLGIASWD